MTLINTPKKRKLNSKEMNHLIQQAKTHPHGIDFFCLGDVESVAIMFDTDVFTVEATREFYNKNRKEIQED